QSVPSYYPSSPYIYTPSLHDALPICHFAEAQQSGAKTEERVSFRTVRAGPVLFGHAHRNLPQLLRPVQAPQRFARLGERKHLIEDRKSTRLNSSHQIISYAVFCLKKK